MKRAGEKKEREKAVAETVTECCQPGAQKQQNRVAMGGIFERDERTVG